jgi:hypothetical protein
MQKQHRLYGYSTLDTTPQELADYGLVPVKMYLTKNSTHRHISDYRRLFRNHPQQLVDHRLVPAKTYLTRNGTHRHILD